MIDLSILDTKLFWLDTGERAVKTAAQVAVALLTVDGVNLISFDFKGFGSAVILATLISVLTSIASAGSGNSASLVVDAKAKK